MFNDATAKLTMANLNDLQNFHILQNPCIDIMHDVDEGVVPHSINLLFKYIIKEKLISKDQLQDQINFFNYGILNKKNQPTNISMHTNRNHFGLNAAQAKCLFWHLSFILLPLKEKIEESEHWKIIVELRKIVQIVYSTPILTAQLDTLDVTISQFLTRVKRFSKLTAKYHNFIM